MLKVRVYVTLFFLIFVCSCRPSKSNYDSSNSEYDTDELVSKAKKHIGTRYKAGGSEPKSGFDCSGFTRYLFSKYNIELPKMASQQAEIGRSVLVSEAKKGDLIFFKGGDVKSRTIGHVGIVITNKGEPIKFIHASSSKGIMISGLEEKYFKERFVRIKRYK